MDNVTIGFICELIGEQNRSNNGEEVIEATEEILQRF